MSKRHLPFLHTSRTERTALLTLVTASVLIWTMPFWYPAPQGKKADFATFEPAVAALRALQADDERSYNDGTTNATAQTFPFNPNTADKATLMALGISEKVATTMLHYREKGGQFRQAEDLKKIYGFRAQDFERLADFVRLDAAPNAAYGNWREQGDAVQNPATVALPAAPFDPNTASEKELLAVGLPQKTVTAVSNYRAKGGKFKKVEDFKKIFTLSELDFLRLAPFIQIADNQMDKQSNNTPLKADNPNAKSDAPIEINNATLAQWLQVRGIGRTFASRILETRDKLGGFARIEQLKEVFGLPDSTYLNILPQLKLTAPIYRKIYVNQGTVEQLSHPYWSPKQIETVVRYRLNHGTFHAVTDLQKVGILSAETLKKIEPYLVF
jgi:competence protein ComEA